LKLRVQATLPLGAFFKVAGFATCRLVVDPIRILKLEKDPGKNPNEPFKVVTIETPHVPLPSPGSQQLQV